MSIRTALLRCLTCFAATVGLCGCTTLPSPPFAKQSAPSKAVIESQLSLARLAERRNDYQRSSEVYEQILKKSPDNAVAHHRLGVILAHEGRTKESLAALREAQRLSPSADILADIGYAHLLDGNLSSAIATLQESLEIEPQNRRALNNLALAKGQQGDYAESLRLFRRATDDAKAHANLAYVMTQNGDLDKAVDVYHRALDYDSDLKLAAQALVQLDDRRSMTPGDGGTFPELDLGSQGQFASYTPDRESRPIQPIPSEQKIDEFNRPTDDGATSHTTIDFAVHTNPPVDFPSNNELVKPQAPATTASNAASTRETDLDAAGDQALVQEGPYAIVPAPAQPTSNTGPKNDFRDPELWNW